MSFPNPTQIRIGMTAIFFGHGYRVIGRSVLGVEEAGRTYCWNEFNLETSGGSCADLVFEETGLGGKWRLFEMFDPKVPLTAREAKDKCVGDTVNLDGTPVMVNRVDRSRVYAVEGKVPEGVVIGQHANYFNAEAGDKMIVVSWTGDDVEFYSGRTIPGGAVASAFNLSGLARLAFAWTGGRGFLNARLLVPLVIIALLGALLWMLVSLAQPSAPPPPTVIVFQAGPSLLFPGELGVLDGRFLRIASHALVQIDEVGLRFSRHEYELADEDNHNYLLISGMNSNAPNWTLCAPAETAQTLTPQKAGSLSAGQILKVDGEPARITKLFRSTILSVDGISPQPRRRGDVLYGFSGAMKSNILIVRWDATNILWLKGTGLADRSVKTAFAPPAGSQAH
ncbi:MAG: DUF4178 domain-containing protein [Verrucomicrobiota bacterium]|jgi:hypothetical protein